MKVNQAQPARDAMGSQRQPASPVPQTHRILDVGGTEPLICRVWEGPMSRV